MAHKIEQPIDPNLVTYEEGCAEAHRSRATIQRDVKAGRLTGYKLGGSCVMVDIREVRELYGTAEEAAR
ncbi:hypothetical protein [Prescottella equi]|uniref:hypothetical protein n=1 Tax=Rhodococcus hoagii TaxID=43767 RepID=UPI000A108618|nr:hypothetical protein [Prescottella equi]ORM00697.1 hypothetical protein A5N69_07075 [Prescottella equi]ORM21562.1 hypothetical protein A5N74_01620 [Prescottella equi]